MIQALAVSFALICTVIVVAMAFGAFIEDNNP